MNEWHKFQCEIITTPHYGKCKLIHRRTGDVWLELQHPTGENRKLTVKRDYFRSPRGKDLDEIFDPINNEHHRHFCNMTGVWFYVNTLRLGMDIEPMEWGLAHKDQALQLAEWMSRSPSFFFVVAMYEPRSIKASDFLLNIPEGIRPPIDPKGVTFYDDPYLQGLQG
jgi:hypothetical protein|tara:strand:+ start:1084 stop:1584 length:501 start_codon:yes stop_codon:yes gene_type:complete